MTAPAIRFLELFAGADGLGMGLEAAGMECAGLAEIDAHARAVLRYRRPGVPLLGDVAAIDAAALAPLGRLDVVSGGSPCQDLSVAGKRAGLRAGARSSLFFEQVRVWRTSGAPVLLWENVVGALSSNSGKDFGRVLSTLAGAPVAVPRDRKRRRAPWARAGRIVGPAGVVAWRVLDLQHFGPPQRRRRVFVVCSRAVGVDPGAVLLECESVCGHSAPRRAQGENAPGSARDGARGDGVVGGLTASDGGADVDGACAGHVVAFQDSQSGARLADTHATLDTHNGPRRRAGVLAFDPAQVTSLGNRSNPQPGAPCHTLRQGAAPLVVFDTKQSGESAGDVAPTLRAMPHDGSHANAGGQLGVIAFHHTQDPISSSSSSPCLGAGTGGMGIHDAGRPRRLMPLECERLMGWPDDWTRYGINERGATYELADGPRYKLCGNGVGAPCAEWIGAQLVDVLVAWFGFPRLERAA